MDDVFISHSGTKDLAQVLAAHLQAAGYSVWWDQSLLPHNLYGDVITQRIGEAKAVLVIWSEAARGSTWVRAEADLARQQNKIVQVSTDSKLLPLPFNQIQCVSLERWDRAPGAPEWQAVLASLAELTHRAPIVVKDSWKARAMRLLAPGSPWRWAFLVALLLLAGLGALVARNLFVPPAIIVTSPPGGYFFVDSNTRVITPPELARLNAAQLRIARNEIYAREGLPFSSADLSAYFSALPWYHPRVGGGTLNGVEQKNVLIIKAAEAARNMPTGQ